MPGSGQARGAAKQPAAELQRGVGHLVIGRCRDIARPAAPEREPGPGREYDQAGRAEAERDGQRYGLDAGPPGVLRPDQLLHALRRHLERALEEHEALDSTAVPQRELLVL